MKLALTSLLGPLNHISKSSPKWDSFNWTSPHRMRERIKKASVWSCLGCFVGKASKWTFAKNWPSTRANSTYNIKKIETRMVHIIHFKPSIPPTLGQDPFSPTMFICTCAYCLQSYVTWRCSFYLQQFILLFPISLLKIKTMILNCCI